MTPPPIPSPTEIAPAAEHLAQLQVAKGLGKKVRRAVLVAKISGVSIAVFAAITVLTGLFDGPTLLLGMAMAVIAVIELRGANALKKLDLQAPQRLALNQAVFGVVLIAYACWQLWANLHAPSELDRMPELKEAMADLPGLEQTVYYAMFLGILAAALVGPGLTAVYYAGRRKHLQAYRDQTPEWIINLQRSGMDL